MLTVSSTLRTLINKTLPLFIGLLAIMSVQLVDSVFIGLLGVNELAAHGMTLPFQTLLIGVQVGIGVGATAIISQAIGAKQHYKARAIASLSVCGGIIFMSLICLLLWQLDTLVLRVFISPNTHDPLSIILVNLFTPYWPYWLFSALSVAVLYLLTSVYRAHGNTKTTGAMFVTASIINLILDPLLMFYFDLGIIGAAIASSLGYAFATLYVLFDVIPRPWFIVLQPHIGTFKYCIELAKVTSATITNQFLPAASAFVAMILIAKLGTDAIAFWSLLARIESFLLVFTLALTMSIPPMVGHYVGARQHQAIDKLLTATAKLLLSFTAFIAVLLVLSIDIVLPLIPQDPTLNTWIKAALWIMPISYGPLGICMVVVSVFNALGTPKTALMVSFARLFILYIPAIAIGTATGDMLNTLIAATIANMLAGIFAWFKLKNHLKSTLAHTQPCVANA
ncbi:MATE family efflux transporter [Shewanella inventionis]|uniref:MATE family efflux transporter n=1 Tax=Shewanella inventionis TaxID=1738770 RepID=UPI001CBC2A45|nr:MATE family efflux transporter [Shewanella inventionis]UAL42194.1 MATE family efflux transporter [Shewanella inventionis]